MDIAERIKTLRKRSALSQEEFAETLGVTRQSVSSWENGTTTPDVKIIVAMCKQFGVSSDYLIFGEKGGEKLSAQESIKSDSKETKQQDQKSKTQRIVKQLIVYLFLTIVGIVSAMNLLLHALEFGLTTTESVMFVVCTIVVVTFGIIVYVVQNNGKKNRE